MVQNELLACRRAETERKKNVPTWCVCRRTVGGCWSSLPPCCWSSPWSPWTSCTRRCTPSSSRSRSRSLLFFDQTNSFLALLLKKTYENWLLSLILAPHINVCHLEAKSSPCFRSWSNLIILLWKKTYKGLSTPSWKTKLIGSLLILEMC
jgi:hypothetical protein